MPCHERARRRTQLVGRDGELDRIAAAWARARSGPRQLVIVEGEAGMRKTTLALEAARRLHQEGGTVIYRRCDRQLLRPYQPFAEPVARYVAVCPADQLTRELAWAPDDVARLAPEVGARLGVQPAPPETDPEASRHRMFAAVGSFFTAMARDAPTVIVLDDLQSADEATVLLLRYVLRTLEAVPLLFVALHRPEELV